MCMEGTRECTMTTATGFHEVMTKLQIDREKEMAMVGFSDIFFRKIEYV